MLVVIVILLAVLSLGFATAATVLMISRIAAIKHFREAALRADSLKNRENELMHKLAAAADDDKIKREWLDHMEQEINYLRRELEMRPKLTRKIYKILTLGIKSAGKTSLTLKWANPLIDLGAIEGTRIERYERTISHVQRHDTATEHVFEISDWGGEHIVDAQQELITEDVCGLLIVVDLGGQGAKTVEVSRVQQQLREFHAQALRYFFSPRTLTSCKTVVLFINKSDLIPGTPAEVEAKAQEYYAPLIRDLMSYSSQIDICIIVGSALSGHGLHHLFAHCVDKILPRSAFDAQLLQQLKTSTTRRPRIS
jgi:GTPase SAR1 family protein